MEALFLGCFGMGWGVRSGWSVGGVEIGRVFCGVGGLGLVIFALLYFDLDGSESRLKLELVGSRLHMGESVGDGWGKDN